MSEDLVSVRYMVDDVDAAIDFYTSHLGFALGWSAAPAFAEVMSFRNDIVSGPGGQQILVDDPSGNPVELVQAAA
jgi:predicted enzyme related to lactoylglutathione lyase